MSETTNTEAILLEYRKTVRNLFDTGASDVIDNSSPRHAAILIEEMVRHAQVSFCAFAGRMNPDVWNANVMAALKEAIQRGVLVRLLVAFLAATRVVYQIRYTASRGCIGKSTDSS